MAEQQLDTRLIAMGYLTKKLAAVVEEQDILVAVVLLWVVLATLIQAVVEHQLIQPSGVLHMCSKVLVGDQVILPIPALEDTHRAMQELLLGVEVDML